MFPKNYKPANVGPMGLVKLINDSATFKAGTDFCRKYAGFNFFLAFSSPSNKSVVKNWAYILNILIFTKNRYE